MTKFIDYNAPEFIEWRDKLSEDDQRLLSHDYSYEEIGALADDKIERRTELVLKARQDLGLEKIPSDLEWRITLQGKYAKLKDMADEYFPGLWTSLEFELAVKSILNIADCSLPFCGIVLGQPGSNKTLGIEMFRGAENVFYTDSFTPKSFVSHYTTVKKEELANIDLLPKIKDKFFLAPELAPIFTLKDEQVLELLGILTRVLDGNGYESDSGAHGHRGYSGEYMFTMIGAAVDIPHRIHKMLGALGPKLYFLRVPKTDNDENTYLAQMADTDSFKEQKKKVAEALLDYLETFRQHPDTLEENGLQKFSWKTEKDDEGAKKAIIRLAVLLSHLRGNAPTWETHDSQGTDYAYTMASIEAPKRAIAQLRNLARGHALSLGRTYISMGDIPLVARVVLSSAMTERAAIFSLLIENQGRLATSQITEFLNTSKPTARRTMAELKAVGLVDLEAGNNNEEGKMTLKGEFEWFLSDDYKKSVKEILPIFKEALVTMNDYRPIKSYIDIDTLRKLLDALGRGNFSFTETKDEEQA